MIAFNVLEGNTQKLDGGAMFGNVPKAVWANWHAPDQDNRVTLACRALLIQTEHYTILLESGIGSFMPPKLKKRYGIEPESHQLLNSLKTLGVGPEEVTHVLLTHLHFDHAGGLLSSYEKGNHHHLVFPNAQFLVGSNHWNRATQPHHRDRASFIPELNELLKDSGKLRLLSSNENLQFDDLQLSFFESQGHTPGMLCPVFEVSGETLMCPADMIPGTSWVHLPITMGYDRFPERLIEEKSRFLELAVQKNAVLFLLHDPRTAWATVTHNENGVYSSQPLGVEYSGLFCSP